MFPSCALATAIWFNCGGCGCLQLALATAIGQAVADVSILPLALNLSVVFGLVLRMSPSCTCQTPFGLPAVAADVSILLVPLQLATAAADVSILQSALVHSAMYIYWAAVVDMLRFSAPDVSILCTCHRHLV